MAKIILGILAFLIIGILLLQIDDDLNQEIPPLLTKVNATHENNAYLYLMGIDAPADSNPITFGKQKLVNQNHSLPKLALPKEEYLTHSQIETFLPTAFKSTTIANTLKENGILLNRYKTFIAMRGFQTSSFPSIDEPYPSYSYLVKGHKLFILKVIHTSKTVGLAESITLLKNHLTHLRLQLKHADTLIGKLIYTALISDSIDVLSILAHQSNEPINIHINPLTVEERSFELPMQRELAFFSNLMTSLDKNPAIFNLDDPFAKEEADQSFQQPAWAVRLFFKPNMSVNQQYQYYDDIIDLSGLTLVAFTKTVQDNSDQQASIFNQFSLRNFTGNVLNNISAPEFKRYVAKVFDLNCKIAIFNQKLYSSEPISINQIDNPYFDKAGTAYYTQDKKSVCLTGPIETNSNTRCLMVAY